VPRGCSAVRGNLGPPRRQQAEPCACKWWLKLAYDGAAQKKRERVRDKQSRPDRAALLLLVRCRVAEPARGHADLRWRAVRAQSANWGSGAFSASSSSAAGPREEELAFRRTR
jgi:hypothetical protein